MNELTKVNWDGYDKPYKIVSDMIDSIDDSLDNTIRCVFETKTYQNQLKNLSQQSNEITERNKSILTVMAPFLLNSLNNPFFDVDEVKVASMSTGLTERQIRDFLRNQRKRKINYLNGLHDNEKENIETKLNYLYNFIDQAINEYVEMGKEENGGDEMEEFVYFPSLNK